MMGVHIKIKTASGEEFNYEAPLFMGREFAFASVLREALGESSKLESAGGDDEGMRTLSGRFFDAFRSGDGYTLLEDA